MAEQANFDAAYAAEQLRRSHHRLRRFVKAFYLKQVLRDVSGPAIDFGCGAGQLLARLPPLSVGVEINPVLVAHLAGAGLNVVEYDASSDDFSFSGFEPNRYRTIVIAHVLEHFPNGAEVMRKIWRSAARLGIEKIVLVIPGKKGYESDPTHRTFITKKYLIDHDLQRCSDYSICKLSYFPGNFRWLGDYLTFHELKVVYERVA